MINLKITHSKEIDVNRIINTLKDWGWFQEKKYRLTLPTGVSPKSDQAEIITAVDQDFANNEAAYQKETWDLLSRWEKYGKILEEKLVGISLIPLSEYELMLTSYGVGGSYHTPNKIIVNIKASFQFGLLRTVLHEIIHLNIEKYIKEFEVSHWTKERIVDLLMNEFFPEVNRMQEPPIPTADIDKQFYAFYPDIVRVIKSVSKII